MLQRTARSHGDVAQLGEHLPCKQGVESSNLFVSIRELSQRKQPRVFKRRDTEVRACSSAG